MNPIEIIAPLFGGKSKMAARFKVAPAAVSNWAREGIPDARKWEISRELRAMRAGGEITHDKFLEAIDALEADPDAELAESDRSLVPA